MSKNEGYMLEFNAIYRSEGLLDRHLAAFDDLPLMPEWAYLYSPNVIELGAFRVDIPFAPERMGEFRRLLGGKWKSECVWTHSQDGDRVHEYVHAELDIKLIVLMDASNEGSTCERVKISEEVVDIYEVRCG